MNEQEWANRFNDDLDAILQRQVPDVHAFPEADASLDVYQEMLALSQTISTLDTSRESRIRCTLKRDLSAGCACKEVADMALPRRQSMDVELKQVNWKK